MGLSSALLRRSQNLRGRLAGCNPHLYNRLHHSDFSSYFEQHHHACDGVLHPCTSSNDWSHLECQQSTTLHLNHPELDLSRPSVLQKILTSRTAAHNEVGKSPPQAKFALNPLGECRGQRHVPEPHPSVNSSYTRGHLGQSFLNDSYPTAVSAPHSLRTQSSAMVTPRRHPARRVPISRCHSNLSSGGTVYGGPKDMQQAKSVTLRHLNQKYAKKEPITMVTAYDYPSAVHVDRAGIDVCLVGDSAAMVVHGYDTTLPVTLDDMLLHCRAVARGASRPLLVGDLPFGSYEESRQQAVRSAVRILKEGNMDAVKLEGGMSARVAAAAAVVEAGIACMGHVGLTPQAISHLGGFRPQGRSAANALEVVQHARSLQDAGCFAVVVECVPPPVAAAITAALHIPTIGIGAGPHCSGQVLVYHDLLGMMQHPHHAKVVPKFCKPYGRIGEAVQSALKAYKEEVTAGAFPSPRFSPYSLPARELDAFLALLRSHDLQASESAAGEAAEAAEAHAAHEAAAAAAAADAQAEAEKQGAQS